MTVVYCLLSRDCESFREQDHVDEQIGLYRYGLNMRVHTVGLTYRCKNTDEEWPKYIGIRSR